jgi:hypothetical protein
MRLPTVVSWLPHPAFARGILFRGTVIWLGVRGLLLFVGLTVPATATAIAIVSLTAWLTTLEARRYSETVLLANLGISEWRLFALGAVPAAVLETVVRLAV